MKLSNVFEGEDLKALRTMRDELKVQAHLFTSEMKSQWEKLEKDWRIVSRNLKEVRPKVKDSVANARHAADPVVGELREAYSRIIEQLRSLHAS